MSGLARRQRSSSPRWSTGAASDDAELRCGCGSLMARLLAGDIELKCRRCKRVVVLHLSEGVAKSGCATDRLACTCEPD